MLFTPSPLERDVLYGRPLTWLFTLPPRRGADRTFGLHRFRTQGPSGWFQVAAQPGYILRIYVKIYVK